jgi:hypothetical protein
MHGNIIRMEHLEAGLLVETRTIVAVSVRVCELTFRIAVPRTESTVATTTLPVSSCYPTVVTPSFLPVCAAAQLSHLFCGLVKIKLRGEHGPQLRNLHNLCGLVGIPLRGLVGIPFAAGCVVGDSFLKGTGTRERLISG